MTVKLHGTQCNLYRIHFLIIGGGIAGLAAAIALRRVGHLVTVLEQDKTSNRSPAGCRIAPNLSKVLNEWGLDEQMYSIASKPESIKMLSYNTGEYLGSMLWSDEVLEETRGQFGLTNYSALRKVLYRTALAHGAVVRRGTEVAHIDAHCAVVTLQCGEVIHADVLIGADGVHGMTRKQIIPQEKATPSNVLKMFSTVIPAQVILNDATLAYLLNRDHDMFVWLGHDHSVVGFHTGNGCDLSLCIYGPEAEPHNLKYILRDSEPSLRKLAKLAPPLTCTPVAHEYVLDEWVKGKMVLIGEAAHPLPPGSMQSCALSVEDGVVLARLFSRIRAKEQIRQLLSAFQSIREPRCASMQTKEVGIVHYMTMPTGEQQEYRDQAMKARRDAGLVTVDASSMQDRSPEWVEVKEVFGYEAEDEADGWWVDWGIIQDSAGPVVLRMITTDVVISRIY